MRLSSPLPQPQSATSSALAAQTLPSAMPGSQAVLTPTPAGQTFVTPGSWVPRYPVPVFIVVTGTGLAVVLVAAVRVAMSATGSGASAVTAAAGVRMDQAGTGTTSVDGVEQYVTAAVQIGSGVTEVAAAQQIHVVAAGSGAAVIMAAAKLAADAVGFGSSVVAPGAAVEILATGTGTTAVGGMLTSMEQSGTGSSSVVPVVRMLGDIVVAGTGEAVASSAAGVALAQSGTGTAATAAAAVVALLGSGSGTGQVAAAARVEMASSGSGSSVVSATILAGSVVAAASVANNTANLSCNKPTGTVSGDVMVAFHMNDASNYAALTAPAGWTLLTGQDQGSGGQGPKHVKIWTKTAGESEPSSYSFATGSVDACVTIVTLRGVASTASWTYSTPTANTVNSSTRVSPSVSGGATTGAILLCYVAVAPFAAATWTHPSGMTELADVQSRNYATHGVARLYNPPNPTGTKTWTCSTSAFWSSSGGIEWSVVIPPG